MQFCLKYLPASALMRPEVGSHARNNILKWNEIKEEERFSTFFHCFILKWLVGILLFLALVYLSFNVRFNKVMSSDVGCTCLLFII